MRKPSYLLLLLPVIGLAAFALLSRRPRTPPTSQPPGLFIESATIEPVTPREVSLGYDRRVKVVLDYSGDKPKWWGKRMNAFFNISPFERSDLSPQSAQMGMWRIGATLAQKRNGHLVPVGPDSAKSVERSILEWEKPYYWSAGRYVTAFLVKLKGIEQSTNETKLLIVAGENLGKITRKEIVLLRAGEKVTPPNVSRETNVRIVKTQANMMLRTTGEYSNEGIVSVEIEYVGRDKSPQWNVLPQTSIEDARGKRWYGVSETRNRYGYFSTPIPSQGDKKQKFSYDFSLKSLPPGKLVLKSGVGIGDGWVEPIEVVIRKDNEALPRLRPTSLKLINVQFRRATTDEIIASDLETVTSDADTTAIVSFRSHRPLPKSPAWNYEYQMFQEGSGTNNWKIKGLGKERSGFTKDVPQWSSERRCWQVRYFLPLQNIPREQARFETHIGLKGEKLMHVVW
jgi:hypothetical protein